MRSLSIFCSLLLLRVSASQETSTVTITGVQTGTITTPHVQTGTVTSPHIQHHLHHARRNVFQDVTTNRRDLHPRFKSSRLVRRVEYPDAIPDVRLEGLNPRQEKWVNRVLDPQTSINQIWEHIFEILYAGDDTIPRPHVSAIDYVIKADNPGNHPLMSHGDTKLVVFDIKIAQKEYYQKLGEARSSTNNEEEADAKAVAATRAEMNGMLLYYATWWFQWNINESPPPDWLAVGIQEWVRLQSGLAAAGWDPEMPDRDPKQGDRLAYFIKWLPASGGMSAGARINRKLMDGYDEDSFWQELFNGVDTGQEVAGEEVKTFATLWNQYQRVLNLLVRKVVPSHLRWQG